MTDLEKRAEEYALDNYENCLYDDFPYINDSRAIEKAYLDATKAETALLSQHILDLQKDKGNLTDRVRKLEQQIEKMKQCGNCGNGTIGNCEYCKRNPSLIFADTLTSDYWKLKEIKRKCSRLN